MRKNSVGAKSVHKRSPVYARKSVRKTLGVMLALVMILSIGAPLTVLAEDETATYGYPEYEYGDLGFAGGDVGAAGGEGSGTATVSSLGMGLMALLDPIQTIPWLRFSTDGKTITGFNYVAGTSPTEITIPKEVGGVTIEAIGNNALSGCGLEVIEFEVGCQIKTIGNGAFQSLPITGIDLPDTVTSIGSNAFQNCTLLATIDLSHLSLKTLLVDTFYYCTSLTDVQLPDVLESISNGCFYNCNSIG